nr:MAG TPA: hypothetical protein [Caudoviricetes sp.]
MGYNPSREAVPSSVPFLTVSPAFPCAGELFLEK